MLDLILDIFEKNLIKINPPLTKKSYIDINITDVKPCDLLKFMQENNIPNDAEFSLKDNGYDGYEGNIYLTYVISVSTTEKDKLDYKKKVLTNLTSKEIRDLFLSNGYYYQYNHSLSREFTNVEIYDMYINKEYEKLLRFYSMFYSKKE